MKNLLILILIGLFGLSAQAKEWSDVECMALSDVTQLNLQKDVRHNADGYVINYFANKDDIRFTVSIMPSSKTSTSASVLGKITKSNSFILDNFANIKLGLSYQLIYKDSTGKILYLIGCE